MRFGIIYGGKFSCFGIPADINIDEFFHLICARAITLTLKYTEKNNMFLSLGDIQIKYVWIVLLNKTASQIPDFYIKIQKLLPR